MYGENFFALLTCLRFFSKAPCPALNAVLSKMTETGLRLEVCTESDARSRGEEREVMQGQQGDAVGK